MATHGCVTCPFGKPGCCICIGHDHGGYHAPANHPRDALNDYLEEDDEPASPDTEPTKCQWAGLEYVRQNTDGRRCTRGIDASNWCNEPATWSASDVAGLCDVHARIEAPFRTAYESPTPTPKPTTTVTSEARDGLLRPRSPLSILLASALLRAGLIEHEPDAALIRDLCANIETLAAAITTAEHRGRDEERGFWEGRSVHPCTHCGYQPKPRTKDTHDR